MEIQLPPPVKNRSLVGVFLIKRSPDYDEVLLATKIPLGKIRFINKHYIFEAEGQVELYPARTSYEGCWFDILTLITNDRDLSIEYAVLCQKLKNSEPTLIEKKGL